MPRKRTSTHPQSGRQEAQRRYPYPLGPCERCAVKPARERHHVDGNTLDNRRENLLFLCTRCHMAVDGRLDRLPGSREQMARALAARWARPRPPGKAACVHGHPYTPENTYHTPGGDRRCRECARIRERARTAAP